MKQIILSAALAGLLFTACQKEDDGLASGPSSNGIAAKNGNSLTTQAISPVPATFIKKVLAEQFVGTDIGATPDASYDMRAVTQGYPGIVYSACLHIDDRMSSNTAKSALKAMSTQPLTYPMGMVDRKPFNGNVFMDSKQFNAAVQNIVNKPIDCGLAISTHDNGLWASIDIHTGFTATMTANLGVMTYLIEDNIITNDPDFEQTNSLNSVPGSTYYNAGNPVPNFEHKYVARCILANDVISSTNMVAGGSQIFTKEFDLPAKYSGNSNFKILSFIYDLNTQEVLNVQQCDLGAEKDWN